MTHFAPVNATPNTLPTRDGEQRDDGELARALVRADMHTHTSASAKPVIHAASWIHAPECYSEPEEVYAQARTRGMDLVAITDHDTIRGALSLVERGFDRVIIGQEVTVRFPEDRVRLHVLVYDLTPDLDEQLTTLRLRDDAYTFAAWLAEHDLPHALAHPLHAQSRAYSLEHLERCMLLFRAVEVLNAAHAGPRHDSMERYLRTLTPGRLDEIARKHSLTPLHPTHARKGITAGSDDHGLLNVGRAWTGVPRPDDDSTLSTRDFLDRVMRAEAVIGGEQGGSNVLAHQIASVAASHYERTIHPNLSPRGRHIGSRLARFAGVRAPSPSRARLAAGLVRRRLTSILPGARKHCPTPLLDALRDALPSLLERYPDLAARLADARDLPRGLHDGPPFASHERMANFFADLSHALTDAMLSGALADLARRDASGAIRHVTGYLVALAAHAPYLIAAAGEQKERDLLTRLDHETAARGHPPARDLASPRVLLFTDTFADVNGVSRFIRDAADRAHAAGHDLTVLTSTNKPFDPHPAVVNLRPDFARPMPRYEHLDVALPPLLPALRAVERARPDVINVATPGPVGLLGLLCAAIFRCPVVGVYHTDFPAYVDRLFDDETFTWLAEKAMRAFYAPFATVLTRSRGYGASLERLGLDPDRIRPLTPGVDTDAFHPRFHDASIWRPLGLRERSLKVVYCGRVSVEKNLPMLERVWASASRALTQRGVDAELVVIGDGPYLDTMRARLPRAAFLGFRRGEELSRLYASADLFVFPSVTDTLGQVVMEAQASGLPVIVTDKGGPQEVVDDGATGLVLSDRDEAGWARAIVDLLTDDDRRARMGRAAHAHMERHTIASSFEHFWQMHVDAHRARLRALGIASDPSPVRAPLAACRQCSRAP